MKTRKGIRVIKVMVLNLLLGCALIGNGVAMAAQQTDVAVQQPDGAAKQVVAPYSGPEKTIRVGVTSHKSPAESITINVNGGFTLYHYADQVHVPLMEVRTSDALIFSKGRKHIQVGPIYLTKEEVGEAFTAWRSRYPSSFIGYDGGWKIYYGTYTDSQSGLTDVRRLQTENADKAFQLDETIDQIVEISDANGTCFLYDAKESQFYVKSIEGNEKSSGLKLQGKSYRGGFGAKIISVPNATNSTIAVQSSAAGSGTSPVGTRNGLILLNYIGIEEYLKGVVTKEMGSGWPLEALKAQAVASRTYTISSLKRHEKLGFDLCNTTDCQVYAGMDSEKPVSNQAVDETKGLVMTYGAKPINAVFHSNSGGRTESAQNIWGGKVPYLVGVEDPYSSAMSFSKWEKSYSISEFSNILAKSGYALGTVMDFQVTSFSENGRAVNVSVIGSNGKKVDFKRENLRAILGSTAFRSIWYDVTFERGAVGNTVSRSEGASTDPDNGDRIVFRGRGYGHGVGMSQWGAKGMAEQRFGFADILTHYYTGIVIESYSK